jgi:hypothetical protein
MKKFHLRVPRLRLCCQHELAAIPTVGRDFDGGFNFRVAWFREQKARVRLRQQLFARQNCGRQKIRFPALNPQNHHGRNQSQPDKSIWRAQFRDGQRH